MIGAHAASMLMGTPCTRARWDVLEDIAKERLAQIAKWGTSADPEDKADRPDGTGSERQQRSAEQAKALTDLGARLGKVTWRDILAEEVAEAFAESDPVKLRAELVQVAAVAVKWIECLDARTEAVQ